jgi:hypothetical protein
MTPSKVGESSTTARKPLKKPMEILEVKEVVGVSTPTPQEKFHRDYLPPRRSDAPYIQLQDNSKYPLLMAPVPDGVSSGEELLRKIANLKYMDHDITNA